MSLQAAATPPHEPLSPELRRAVVARFLQLALQLVLTGALLFGCAGSLAWARGWLYLGVMVGSLVALGVWVLPRNPEVVAARGRLHRDTAPFDKVLVPVYSLCSGAVYAVGALDAGRFAWAPLGWPWSIAGALLLLASIVPIAGAMAANRNLETTVRIQTDRGHQVATEGPYRVVRHPMYAASLVQAPAIALLLGSAWALVPAAAACACVVVRTALEDRTLRAQLPGYAAYAQRTRYRLVPGLW